MCVNVVIVDNDVSGHGDGDDDDFPCVLSCRPSPMFPDSCLSVGSMLWKDLWPKT